ncbi:hypothetical protein THAOC_35394, partial [Thalassiosira oceanica]
MPQEPRWRRIQISYSSAAILTVEDGRSVAVDAAVGRSEPAPFMALKIANFQRSIYDLRPTAQKCGGAQHTQHALPPSSLALRTMRAENNAEKARARVRQESNVSRTHHSAYVVSQETGAADNSQYWPEVHHGCIFKMYSG